MEPDPCFVVVITADIDNHMCRSKYHGDVNTECKRIDIHIKATYKRWFDTTTLFVIVFRHHLINTINIKIVRSICIFWATVQLRIRLMKAELDITLSYTSQQRWAYGYCNPFLTRIGKPWTSTNYWELMHFQSCVTWNNVIWILYVTYSVEVGTRIDKRVWFNHLIR